MGEIKRKVKRYVLSAFCFLLRPFGLDYVSAGDEIGWYTVLTYQEIIPDEPQYNGTMRQIRNDHVRKVIDRARDRVYELTAS